VGGEDTSKFTFFALFLGNWRSPAAGQTRTSSLGPHVRFRRVRTREGSPLIKLRNSAARFSRLTNGCGVGFRQLRTCRRTRPGQLCNKFGRNDNSRIWFLDAATYRLSQLLRSGVCMIVLSAWIAATIAAAALLLGRVYLKQAANVAGLLEAGASALQPEYFPSPVARQGVSGIGEANVFSTHVGPASF